MKKELKYMIIDYTEEDKAYIDSFTNLLEKISQEIIDFFAIEKIDTKINVKLYNSLEEFRKIYVEIGFKLDKNGQVPNWICGFAFKKNVYTLSLKEYRKTKGHENDSLNDLIYLILHEFTHACNNIVSNNKKYAWLSEGLATTISHQYDNYKLFFNCSLNEMINGPTDYRNYHTMFSYVYKKYGKYYILSLINDFNMLEHDTPILFEEVKDYFNNLDKNKQK